MKSMASEQVVSKLTIPWVAVLSMVAILIGYIFLSMMGYGERIVRLETVVPTIVQGQEDIKQALKEIRQDQIDRKRAGYPEYKRGER